MSFQAYLDNIEKKTGKTPNEFIALARSKGYNDPSVKAGIILAWLKEEFGLARGYGMALVHVIKTATTESGTHLNNPNAHLDGSGVVRLDGLAKRD